MTPERTSPVPAVASRASPEAASRARPSGAAMTDVEPFSSTIAPLRRAACARLGQTVGARGMAGQSGELAGMGRYHRGVAAVGDNGRQGFQGPYGVQAVGIDDGGHAGCRNKQAYFASGKVVALGRYPGPPPHRGRARRRGP